MKEAWLKMLQDARTLIDHLPPDEVGCLYYSTLEKKFVTPPLESRPQTIQPHYGRVGGILPKVVED